MSVAKQFVHSAIWISASLASALLVVFAWNMYPVPDGDSIFFLPAIKAYASTGVVDNKLVDLSFITDPDGLGRFLFYTPGFPVVLGFAMSLFGASSYQLTLFFLSLARVASVFLFAKSLVVILRRYGLQRSPFFVLPASALVFSSGLFLFASNGRPEILSILLVSGSLLAALSIDSSLKKHLVLALCIGFLFPVSIANGIIGCSFFLLYLFQDVKSVKIRFALLSFALASGFLLIVLSYLAAGLPLEDGFRGLYINSKMLLGRNESGLGLIFAYWKSWIIFAILSAIYMGIVLYTGPAIRDKTSPSLNRLWLGFSLAFIAYLTYFFGLRAAPIHYNLYAFLPLYQFLAFRLFINLSALNSRIFSYSLQGVLFAALSLSLLDPLRAAILFPYYLASGSTYSQAMNNFLALDVGECNLMYTAGLFVLDESQRGSQFKIDDSSRALVSKRVKHLWRPQKCIVAIVQEVNSNSRPPVSMQGIADHRDRSSWTPRLKALRLLNSPKGYSFFAYKQELPL